MSIGKKLTELLKSQGIEEIELAQHLGISPERLSNYLDDKREPEINMLNKAAKYLSVSLDYFVDEPMDMQEQYCQGLTLGYIENLVGQLDDHQKLVNYLAYEIDNISQETITDKRIYAYMLELSNSRIEEICEELDKYTLKERKRILRVG